VVRQSWHVAALNAIHRPIHPGLHVRNRLAKDVATISCILTMGGKPFIVTSEHVADRATTAVPGVANVAKIGDILISSTDEYPVARVAAVRAPSAAGSYFDAALSSPLVPFSYEIPHIGIPKGHKDPVNGMKIKGIGLKSGFVSSGTIIEANSTKTQSKAEISEMQGLGTIRDTFTHSMPMGGGDSGGPILTEDNYILGFHTSSSTTAPIVRRAYKASALIKGYGGTISFAGKPGVFGPDGQPTTITPIAGTPSVPSASASASASPSPSPTTSDDPIAVLIQIILAFIEDLLAAIGAKR
jgi:hypothetical protein